MSGASEDQDTGLRMTRDAYRVWTAAQRRGRFERIDGAVIAMAPERGAHLRIKANVYVALRRAIAEARLACQALPDGSTVEIGDTGDYEPDAAVNRGEPMGDDDIAMPNPITVVEVLSPSTRSNDQFRKLPGYFSVPSIQHYLIVSPAQKMVIHHRRQNSAGGIGTQIVASGDIRLDPPGIVITVAEVFQG